MRRLFDWFRRNSDGDDNENIKLHQVKWSEEIEREYKIVTVRLVWSGGAEKEVTHCPDMHHYHSGMNRTEYIDIDGNSVLQLDDKPAYREVISSEETTRTETKRRTAWVDSVKNLPAGVEKTGKTKYVSPTEAPDHD